MVGISYGEFQGWYNRGEIKINTCKIVAVEKDLKSDLPVSDSSHITLLIDQLPQLALDDEEGLMFVEFDYWEKNNEQHFNVYNDPNMVTIPTDSIRKIIPLTDRSHRILQERLGKFGVKICDALFKKQVERAWHRMGVKNALNGGKALASAIFDGDNRFHDKQLRKAISDSLWLLDESRKDEGNDNSVGTQKSWISDAFSFTRYEPYKKGIFDPLIDAGQVLKKDYVVGDRDDSLECYRKTVKYLLEQYRSPNNLLSDIFQDDRYREVEGKLANISIVPKITLSSLVMFLRWKETFHKLNQEIDFESLVEDCSLFSKSAGIPATSFAIWLLGCFVGYETIATFVYSSTPNRYVWFVNKNFPEVKRISITENLDSETEQPPVTKVKERKLDSFKTTSDDSGEVSDNYTKGSADSDKLDNIKSSQGEKLSTNDCEDKKETASNANIVVVSDGPEQIEESRTNHSPKTETELNQVPNNSVETGKKTTEEVWESTEDVGDKSEDAKPVTKGNTQPAESKETKKEVVQGSEDTTFDKDLAAVDRNVQENANDQSGSFDRSDTDSLYSKKQNTGQNKQKTASSRQQSLFDLNSDVADV